MKKQLFSPQELALLSIALERNLFTIPISGQLLVGASAGNGGYYIYFEDSYYKKITSSIQEKYLDGQFSKSNAESDWKNFMNLVNSAESTTEDTSKLEVYRMLNEFI